MAKPRVMFCWLCGRKLRGVHHKEMEVQGHNRILHKQCADEIENNPSCLDDWETEIADEVTDWH